MKPGVGRSRKGAASEVAPGGAADLGIFAPGDGRDPTSCGASSSDVDRTERDERTAPAPALGPPALVEELPVHPIARLFPDMTAEEYASLKKSIAAHGQREPILVSRGAIADGRQRHRACRDLGIEPKFEEWDGQGSLAALIVDRNLERRHLSVTRRARLALALKPVFEEEARSNLSRGGQGLPDLAKVHCRDLAAQAVKVSSALVGSLEKVVDREAPELIAVVGREEVRISAAADVVALDRASQARLVAEGPEAVRAEASALRAARGETKARRPGATAPGRVDAASVSAPEAGTADLLPAPGWLEGFALRSRLANPACFDFSATLWRVARGLRTRLDLPAGVIDRPAHAISISMSLDPSLLEVALATPPPEAWTLCQFCAGSGREDDGRCLSCRGNGFRTG